MKMSDLNFFDIGNKIGLTGAVFSDDDNTVYLAMYPTQPEPTKIVPLMMDLDEWTKFLQQLDVQETEVLRKAADGKLAKAILRKTQRVIEQRVSWTVYRRDSYRCRYCNIEGVPMTVDHLVLWEDGGPSVEENLVTACRKCNKTRGNLQYRDWLKDPFYLKVSKKLSSAQLAANEALLPTLNLIPRHQTERSVR